MYDPKTNEVKFPHIIMGNKLGSKEFSYYQITGKVILINEHTIKHDEFFKESDIDDQSFMGGNVKQLKFMEEYGVYACPHIRFTQLDHRSGLVWAFYIKNANELTDKGVKALKEIYGDKVKLLGKKEVKTELTPEEKQIREEKLEELGEMGEQIGLYKDSTIDEIQGLIDSAQARIDKKGDRQNEEAKVKISVEKPKATSTKANIIQNKGKSNVKIDQKIR